MNDSAEMLRPINRPISGKPVVPLNRGEAALEALTDEQECTAFGYLRGIRDRALSIEFRLANGNCVALPYAWVGPMTYNPSVGILLKFVGDLIYLVLIEGSNLNRQVNGSVSLFDRGIQRHRITWVRELSRQDVQRAKDDDVTVERIRIVSHRHDEEPKGAEWLDAFREQA